MSRTALVLLAVLLAGCGGPAPEPAAAEWSCPMDPDVRASAPGKCPRCGMDLSPAVAELLEYPVVISTQPAAPRPLTPVTLRFAIRNPHGERATKFRVVHEKLFHLFIVSRNLSWFAHEHPEPQPDGTFRHVQRFPFGGEFRLLADFYPDGGTPQMAPGTLILPGAEKTAPPIEPENVRISMRTTPDPPRAGINSHLEFTVEPDDGLERWLGAWGHLLAVSSDLIDMVHAHPESGAAGEPVVFNVIFPRAGEYRVWPQFQRRGVVNTGAFTLRVSE